MRIKEYFGFSCKSGRSWTSFFTLLCSPFEQTFRVLSSSSFAVHVALLSCLEFEYDRFGTLIRV